MLTTVEIRPADGRKSFYGKAKMVRDDDSIWWSVKSYSTIVCLVRKTDEGMVELVRTWSGYSRTTMRHIQGALAMLHAGGTLCKKDWDSIPLHGKVVVE